METALSVASAAAAVGTAISAATIFPSLPADARIPMQFGLRSEVTWSLRARKAVFVYPLMAAAVLAVTMHDAPRAKDKSAERRRRLAMGAATNVFMLFATTQIGAIARGERRSLQPTWSTGAFLGILSSIGLAWYVETRSD